MTEVFKSYRFGFDKALYTKKFKEALLANGVKKPADFNALLRRAGVKDYDYETVKSYFYPDRRMPPLPVLAAVCRALKISAHEIAFSGGFPPAYDRPIGGSFEASLAVESAFLGVFEADCLREGTLSEEDEATLAAGVETLAAILARYHYLLSKYCFAALSGRETAEMVDFTERYLVTADGFFAPWEELASELKNWESDGLLDAFYKRYSIGLFGSTLEERVREMKPSLPTHLGEMLSQLLPPDQR